MQCSRCRQDNLPEARFCMACGAGLGQRCRHCARELPAEALFCFACGQPVAGASATPRFRTAEAYTPTHLAERILISRTALEGERKQVTVLFADMKGSMELLADRDPEEARKLLDPVLERMMDAVHAYEGIVNQVMGDGVMALFGAPLAHEDHALRACYAALRMQESVKRYAEGLRRAEGVPILIRVGLNSGDVVVRAVGSDLRMDYTAVGQTTHLAARMEQMALPGTVALTPSTLALVEGFVHVLPLGPMRLKGLADPLEVYELTGASQARSRLQAGALRGLTRFVGRDAELAQLARAHALAGQGRGQVVTVVGEPGVGKSRLLHEFTRAPHTRGWLVLEGAATLRESAPYQLFIDLLRASLHVNAGDDAFTVRGRLASRLLALDPALESALPPLSALLDASPEDAAWEALDAPQQRRRTLDAVRRWLLRESQVQPLLLLVEDAQWADSGSQAGLDLVVESLPAARILLLVSCRPEYEPGWDGKAAVARLRLAPLSAGGVDDLIDAILGPDPSVASLRPLLAARAEGNPFFLEESVRTLADTGVLAGKPGSYHLIRPVAAVQVPPTVEAILAARMDLLTPEHKRLLQVAAAVGRDVPLVILEAVADLPAAALHGGLARLEAAEFLREARLFPEREYAFKHALTHEVAYRSLLRSARQAYHRRIAEALLERVPGAAETRPELLAHHWAEAGVPDKAVSFWQRAARRAIERSAHAEAIRHLTRALDALGTLPDTDERAKRAMALYLLLTNSVAATRGYAELEPICVKLRELAPRAGADAQTALRVLVPQWMFHAACGPLPTARAIAEEGLAIAERSGESSWVLLGCVATVHSLRLMGEFTHAVALADRGLALYDPAQHAPRFIGADEDTQARLLRDRAISLWVLGYPEQALAQMQEAVEHARRLAHPYSLGWALASAASLYRFARQPRAAMPLIDEALVVAREHGFALQVIRLEALRGWARCAERRLGEGMAALEQSLAMLRARGMVVGLPESLLSLAAARHADKRTGEGLAILDETAALITRSGEHEHDAPLHRLRGEMLAHLGEEAAAERELRAAIEVAGRQRAHAFELGAATSLAELLGHRGRGEEARTLLGGVYAAFTEGFDTPELRTARALLDTLA